MKIYTKTGDKGETSLFGGGRVRKNDPRVAAYGEVDELNSVVGVLIAQITATQFASAPDPREALVKFLQTLQNRLFDLGAELAAGDEKFRQKLPRRIDMTDIVLLEAAIDRMEERLIPLKNFILPGGAIPAAQAHVCRSVSRRAERAMLTANAADLLIAFINRVSDYFFVLARHLNSLSGVAEPEWEK